MIPSAVVADVGSQERFYVREFGVPERKMSHEPLPVGPDVVVFGVFGKRAGEEGDFGWGKGGDAGHDGLAVVPG